MLRFSTLVLVLSLPLLMLGGCNNQSCEQDQQSDEAMADIPDPCVATGDAETTVAAAGPDASKKTGAAVASIVFVDKENACACTKARIKSSWDALHAALPQGHEIPIQIIHLDTQADQAKPLRAKRAMVAVPGVYFLDADGELITLLQGELTAEQFKNIL